MRNGGGAEPAPSEDVFLHLFHNLSHAMAVLATTDGTALMNTQTTLDA